MIVFDFDGIIIESRWGEKLWRWLAEKMRIKTPKIFFSLQEVIEVGFNIKPKLIGETVEAIKRLNQNGYDVGLLTDRSIWYLDIFFTNNNRLVNFNSFIFIQGRKSFLNRLAKNLPQKTLVFELEKTKSDSRMFKNLKRFATKNNIETQEILIIDDLPQVIECAKANGFLVSHVKY